MYRHKRNIDQYKLPSLTSYNTLTTTVDSSLTYSNLYLPLINTLSDSNILSYTNCSLDTTNYLLDNSSVKFNSGFIQSIYLDISYNYTFQTFLYLLSNSTNYYPLLSIYDLTNTYTLFSISYNLTLSKLVISRLIEVNISSNVYKYDIRYLSLVQSISTWSHIALVRKYNVITLYLNLEQTSQINNYYHNIPKGNLYLGKEDISATTSYLSANLSNYQIINTNGTSVTNLYPNITSLVSNNQNNISNTNPLVRQYLVQNSVTENSLYYLVNLHNYDYCSNVLVLPTIINNFNITNSSTYSATYYDGINENWYIYPSNLNLGFINNNQGLTLYPSRDIEHPLEFTLEVQFKILSNTITSINGSNQNIVIISNWLLSNNQYYYFIYNTSLNIIQFIYKVNGSNIVNILNLDGIVLDYYNYLTLQVFNDSSNYNLRTIELYVNGIKQYSSVINLRIPPTIAYSFNYNVNANININSVLYLKTFNISYGRKYLSNYLTYCSSNTVLNKIYSNAIVNYRDEFNIFSNREIDKLDFNLSGEFVISLNSFNLFYIVQNGIKNYNITYSIQVSLIDSNMTDSNLSNSINYTDLVLNDINISSNTLVMEANTNQISFSISLSNILQNEYKRRFKLTITNNLTTHNYLIYIVDTNLFNSTWLLNQLSSVANFNDAYIVNKFTNAGSLVNINNSNTATTSASLVNNIDLGNCYILNSVNDVISLNKEYSNVQTIFFIYKELNLVEYRVYVGDSNSYTFNGGVNGELVGNLYLASNDYSKINTLAIKSFNVCISKSGNAYAVSDEVNNVLYLYTKNDSGIWNSNYITLNTGITDINYSYNTVFDFNEDGTALVIGIKNADTGAGRVQVWLENNGIWSKDLDLSSPVPSPYYGGFGNAVCIRDDYQRIYVNEISSNKVYEFTRTSGIWSAIPTAIITNSDTNFGYKLKVSSDGTLLAILALDSQNLRLYNLISNTWTIVNTFSNVQDFYLSKDGLNLIISNYTSSNVLVYSLNFSNINNNYTVTLVKTLNSVYSNYGYAVDIDNNKNIAIASPIENKVYIYFISDNYTTPISFNGSNDYGYSISKSDSDILISNFNNVIDLYSNDGSTVTQNIVQVRQNSNAANLSDLLDSTNIQVLSFVSNTNLNISEIGNSKTGIGLNGLFYGLVMYNRALQQNEILTIENVLLRYFQLENYSFYNVLTDYVSNNQTYLSDGTNAIVDEYGNYILS